MYSFDFLSRTQEYFTHAKVANIMVGGTEQCRGETHDHLQDDQLRPASSKPRLYKPRRYKHRRFGGIFRRDIDLNNYICGHSVRKSTDLAYNNTE